jgi:aminoglycoside phosphotransferase (APT) family kinase protein
MTGIAEGSPLAAVRGYAAEVVGRASDQITAVSRFEHGNRHAVYKVSYRDGAETTQHVVVRVCFCGDPADCAQAEREALVLETVGGLAAPPLYDCRCASGWFETPAMCMQFVAGPQHDLGAASPAAIERLGSVVAWVHEQPTDTLVGPLAAPGDITSYAEHRLQSVLSGREWLRDPLPADIQARLNETADALQRRWATWRDAESFNTSEPLAPLHGDIVTDNVLWGPDPVLIDWEYTRLGDPADEIAYLFDQNGLSTPQKQAFWRGYRDSLGSEQRLAHVSERVGWWAPLTLLGSSLWWVERWVRRTEADTAGTADPEVHREPSYYFDHMTGRLDRLEHLLDRP